MSNNIRTNITEAKKKKKARLGIKGACLKGEVSTQQEYIII